jgi:hypothetical protein
MARDDFNNHTKLALAERVGYRCSFPGCGALTVGPSDEANDSSSATGMACHIGAASGGASARRFRPGMSPAERSSIANGIWMCYKHGKLIDTDESRFTVEMLQKWRELAEERARFLQTHGQALGRTNPDYSAIGLASTTSRLVGPDSENSTIGDAIRYSCVPEVWGPAISECVRDFSIESARNSFQHGLATFFELGISPTYIRLIDDGASFDIWKLTEGPKVSGGRLAFSALLELLAERVVVVGRRNQGTNEVIISRIADAYQLEDLTPCVTWVDWRDVRKKQHQIVVDRACHLVYVILPPYWTPSDSVLLVEKVKRESHNPSRFVFVLEQASDTSRRIIREAFPECRIVNL